MGRLGLGRYDRLQVHVVQRNSRCVRQVVSDKVSSLEHFGLENVVDDIKLLQPGEAHYDKTLAALARTDRFSEKQGRCIALVTATAGAELVAEFESLEVEST